MTDFTIDPSRGPHAAAGLSDEALEYLYKILTWELAIRTSRETFVSRLLELLEAREDIDETIDELRRERELMRFASDVLADIARLPLTASEPTAETYGMYL